MMTSHDRPDEIRYLVEEIGMERADAEKALEDGDLWVLGPECLYIPSDAEEAVREWEQALEFAKGLCRGFADDGTHLGGEHGHATPSVGHAR